MPDIEFRLTSLAHGGGCGCKLSPAVLTEILAKTSIPQGFSNLLVGTDTSDDAAVYQINDRQAVVATTDFFTPVVDNPYDFGRIAATNALSDVYAMGGTPILALAILGIPVDKIPTETVQQILAGGVSVCADAGVPVAGGHSIDSPEPNPLAPRPALAIGYHMPDRNTPEYYAMGLIEQMLIEGNDALLYKELAQKRGMTDSVEGGINALGNMFNYSGPMLLFADVRYDPATKPDDVLKAMDAAIDPLREKPVDPQLLERSKVKLLSSMYDQMGQFGGFGLMDMLASFALFDDDPARVNGLELKFEQVSPELIQKTAQEYLRPGNRTVIELQPKPKESATPAKNQ